MHELSNRVRNMHAVQADLEMIKKRAANLKKAAKEQITSTVSGPIIAMYSNYLHSLRKLDLETRDKLTQTEADIDKQRGKLIKASVDRKIIERFKEIKRQAYEKAELEKELKIFDEINTLRAGRKNEEK